MERTDKQKEQLLEDLWYSRKPCHDNDQEGNDRFWGTVLCIFNDYQKALNIPDVVGTETEEEKIERVFKDAGHNIKILGKL